MKELSFKKFFNPGILQKKKMQPKKKATAKSNLVTTDIDAYSLDDLSEIFIVDFETADSGVKSITDSCAYNWKKKTYFDQNGEFVIPRIPVNPQIAKYMKGKAITQEMILDAKSRNTAISESIMFPLFVKFTACTGGATFVVGHNVSTERIVIQQACAFYDKAYKNQWVIYVDTLAIVREKLSHLASKGLGFVYCYLKKKDGFNINELPNEHRARGDVDALMYIINHIEVKGELSVCELLYEYANKQQKHWYWFE